MPIIGNPIYQSAFVVDQFSGNGSTTAFTMSVAPAGVTNVLVAVSGVLQDPSTYGVVGNTITFSAAPPSGTGNISCRYLGIPVTGVTTTAYRTVTEFTATASQTTFTPPSYTVGFINVYLNGVLLGSADYTATNGTTVVLTTGASAGNLLTVESFLVSSVLNAIPNTAGSVSSSNIQTSVALTTPTMTSPTISSGALTIGTTSLGAGNASSFKNRIINGSMTIDQRNAGASVAITTAAPFITDRFFAYASQTSKLTGQQNAGSVTPPVGFTNYLGFTSLSAYSVLASDIFVAIQRIEGFNTADLGWGTANAKTVTLSFQVYSSLTGTFGGSLQNSAQNRSYPFTYSIPSANTWTTISVTIAGDTTGTWIGATNGIGIQLNFGLGMGSTYSGTAGSWQASNLFSATGATSVVGTSGATFYITGVQLEVGSTATSFDYRPYGTELALCQRYFEKIGFGSNDSRYPTLINYSASSSEYSCTSVSFVVAKRTVPTIVDGTINLSNATSGIDGSSIQGFRFCVIAAAAGIYGGSYLTSGVTASAEL
jgi:hypothetical protein